MAAVRLAVASVRPGARARSPTGIGFGLAGLVVVALGLGAGVNPFFASYYSATTWVPIGLVVVLVAAVVVRPDRFGGPAALAAGGLLGLGMWSLGSAAWARSVENAVVDGDRVLVYGALVVLVVVLLAGGSERRSRWLLAALGAGIGAVSISVLARLGGDPAALLYMGRLNAPLGYVNGEGCVFVMGLWLWWPAAESRRAFVAGAGAGVATLMACLAFLSQSRGTALAVVVSLFAVVLAAPGRRRRIYGLLFLAVGVAYARAPLLAVYHHPDSAQTAHAAAKASILAAVGGGVAWAVAVAAEARLEDFDQPLASRLRRAGSGLLIALALAGVGLAGASAQRIERSARSQWHAFTHLADPVTTAVAAGVNQSRLLSGAGNRYDYWRVAWRVWTENPLVGVGAGNYDRPYFLDRATSEDISQPHSLELQTLCELGLVGAGLLALVGAGVAAGVRRLRRCAPASARARNRLVAGLGAFAAWLTQTSVDWLHLLPGVTAVALCAMAVLVVRHRETGDGVRPSGAAEPPSRSTRSRLGGGRPQAGAAALVAVVLVLVVAEASLSRQGLADLYRVRAQRDIYANPTAALREANRSLSFDADAVTTYYLKAAALARFDEAVAARDALTDALRHEPDNFVTWTLLGDIAVRRGKLHAAKYDYARAHALNPRDQSLNALAADPRAGAR